MQDRCFVCLHMDMTACLCTIASLNVYLPRNIIQTERASVAAMQQNGRGGTMDKIANQELAAEITTRLSRKSK